MLKEDQLVLDRRRLLQASAVGVTGLTGLSSMVANAEEAQDELSLQSHWQRHAFATTIKYVIEFYPLWFTYYQSFVARQNILAGPIRVSPLYHIVVAINVDTIYASAFINVVAEPVILTIPWTRANYSVLNLDPYGNVFETDIKGEGKYALTTAGYSGPLPIGAKRIDIPFDVSILIFRVDRHSGTENQSLIARGFRAKLKLQTLTEYNQDKDGGKTLILPEAFFSIPFKTAVDELITRTPLAYLRQLQRAVHSSNTPPLTPEQKILSDEFDNLFGDGGISSDTPAFRAGARRAHEKIIHNYLSNRGTTNWITFTNIGNWGDNVLDRASITEFIQYGNGRSTAAYYHAFRDGAGVPLHGRRPLGYVLTFAKDEIPEASRFWSLTAYTPDSIELISNPARKYVIGSYTPDLEYNGDGSLSIYISRRQPHGVPAANWLPVGREPFNIMLRVYGPEGSVADNTYVPPPIWRR